MLRKQAQQLPTGSGLRPTDVSPMSRNANKLDNQFKRPAPPCSGTATSVKGRPLGSLEKAARGTHDKLLSPASCYASPINAAISVVPPGTGSDPKREIVTQFSATSCSGPSSRSEMAQTLSTQASVSRPSRDSGFSLAVNRRKRVPSWRRAFPASTSTNKQHCSDSMDRPADILFHEIPDQTLVTHTSPPDPMPVYACQTPAIEATHAHSIIEGTSLSPKENSRGAHMYPTSSFGARLIVCPQLLYRVQYPRLFQFCPYRLLALHLTYPTNMRPMNFLNRDRFTAKHLIRISPHPSLSTLHVLRLRIHANLLMITRPCNPLPMTTASGQRFLNASHGPVGCQVN